MDVTSLRMLNDELRSEAVKSLRQLNDAEVFAPYVESYKSTLMQCDLMDETLDELEKEVDSQAE